MDAWRMPAFRRAAVAWAVVGALLGVSPLPAQTAPVLLSSACFDSLPFGREHTCALLFRWESGRPQDTLIAALATALADDSVMPAVNRTADLGHRAVVVPRGPRGCCGAPFAGRDSLTPVRALRLSTEPMEQGTSATVYIEATVRTVPGFNNGPLKLAMCYLLHVLAGLDAGPISLHPLVVPADRMAVTPTEAGP